MVSNNYRITFLQQIVNTHANWPWRLWTLCFDSGLVGISIGGFGLPKKTEVYQNALHVLCYDNYDYVSAANSKLLPSQLI